MDRFFSRGLCEGALWMGFYLVKIRLAFSSFDLIAGLTSRELEDIPTYGLAFPFFYLLACFWLILGLRKPRKE